MSGSARAGTKTGVAVGIGISVDDERPDELLNAAVGAVVAVGSAAGISVTIGSEGVLVAGVGMSEGERVDVGTEVRINDFTVSAVVAANVGSGCGDGSTEIACTNSGSTFWQATINKPSPPTPIRNTVRRDDSSSWISKLLRKINSILVIRYCRCICSLHCRFHCLRSS